MMNAEQKAAFLNERCGRLTGSNMWKAMDFTEKGKPSAARTKYQYEIIAERITGQSAPHVVTDAMTFGAEHEDEAVDYFVERTGRSVRQSRIYHHPTIDLFSATPDRELDDGLLEIKVPQPQTFVQWVMAGVVPKQHIPQLAAQLLCTGKRWVGFCAYSPTVRDEKMRLFMRKYEPTTDELLVVEAAAIKFLDEVEIMFSQFVEGCAA